MAEEEIARVVGEAERRWPLFGVTVIHRTGKISPGGQIVLVVCAFWPSRGGLFGRRIPDGFFEKPRAVLEEGASRRRRGRATGSRPKTATRRR